MIVRNQTYVDLRNGIDCTVVTSACYRVTYENTADISGGTTLVLSVNGPRNPLSVV